MNPNPGTQPKRKRLSKRIGVALLAVVLAVGGYVLYQLATDNFHAVVAGQVYRSCRMNPATLAQTVQAHGIKSVVSLIGTNSAEDDTLESLGAEYYCFSLSDQREVTDEQMEQILAHELSYESTN